jgi:hypothetical protein
MVKMMKIGQDDQAAWAKSLRDLHLASAKEIQLEYRLNRRPPEVIRQTATGPQWQQVDDNE